ncbi:MAG: hypothetical protein AAGA03_00650 [Planctomycetota bacterium]
MFRVFIFDFGLSFAARSRSVANTYAVLALLALLISGCGPRSHPGNWGLAKVQDELQTKLNLVSIELQEVPGEGFAGSGKHVEGETFTIAVRQDATARRLEYDANGDRGTIEEGHFEM